MSLTLKTPEMTTIELANGVDSDEAAHNKLPHY